MPTLELNIDIDKTTVGLSNVDNTSDANKPVSTAQQTALNLKEDSANKATDFSTVNHTKFPTVQAAKTYMDGLVVGLLDDRGSHDASGNMFPSTGGSGTAGAVMKGDLWFISVGGTLGTQEVTIGDSVRAMVDSPGQTASNWNIIEVNINYVPENQANKSTDVNTDQASSTKYPTVKSVYDWAVGLFAPIITSTNFGSFINGLTGKTTPVDADYIGLMDSAASNVLKKLSWANVKVILKAYFDTVYLGISAVLTGYTSGAGIVAATDTILQAIQKLNGNSVAQLASYYTLFKAAYGLIAGENANTYWMGAFGSLVSSSGNPIGNMPQLIYIAAADYPSVNGLTPKLRIRAQVLVNHVAPTGNITFGLYPITAPASSGGAGVRSHTIGAVVSGSNGAVCTTPAADTNHISGVTAGFTACSDFSLPADGLYVICIVTTATIATSSYVECIADLQITYK